MKKLCILITFILVFFILPVSALADEAGSGNTSQPTQTIGGTSIAIDNVNIYEGMDKAYKDGYTLTVKNGVATVMLPIVASAEIKGNTITATPGLGDVASSPFVFKNYQKTVTLSSNVVSGGAKVPSYLVRFDLSLAAARTNGVYPITMDIKAQGKDGTNIQQTFTSYITITDGKEPASTKPPEPEKPTSQPKIILSAYNVNPSPVTAGQDFTATVTLKNTSGTKAVQNMSVTVSCDSPKLSLQSPSNTFFIDNLGVGKTKDITLKYKTDMDTPAQGFNIMFAMAYDNAEATPITSTGTITVTVNQPLQVKMQVPQIAESVNAGDTLPLSFQVMNMGRGKVYNVRCDLNVPGLITKGTAFIGNLEAGTASKADMSVFIGTKNMSKDYKGNDKYGATKGTVTLIYEDKDGKEYTQDVEFSTIIKDPGVGSVSDKVEEEPKKAGQWWVSIVIGCFVIGGLSVVLIARGKKGKHHEDI
ncbi:MAG: hypothetical protein H7Y18_06485 [Clostridiaceae bacterium]|nr:hypothetical protein [Clostridiaceae bacterium]